MLARTNTQRLTQPDPRANEAANMRTTLGRASASLFLGLADNTATAVQPRLATGSGSLLQAATGSNIQTTTAVAEDGDCDANHRAHYYGVIVNGAPNGVNPEYLKKRLGVDGIALVEEVVDDKITGMFRLFVKFQAQTYQTVLESSLRSAGYQFDEKTIYHAETGDKCGGSGCRVPLGAAAQAPTVVEARQEDEVWERGRDG
eukprot:3612071-Rhodomonas_salina.1